jgi:hypothetical protein
LGCGNIAMVGEFLNCVNKNNPVNCFYAQSNETLRNKAAGTDEQMMELFDG